MWIIQHNARMQAAKQVLSAVVPQLSLPYLRCNVLMQAPQKTRAKQRQFWILAAELSDRAAARTEAPAVATEGLGLQQVILIRAIRKAPDEAIHTSFERSNQVDLLMCVDPGLCWYNGAVSFRTCRSPDSIIA
jgi:hypothetical protein